MGKDEWEFKEAYNGEGEIKNNNLRLAIASPEIVAGSKKKLRNTSGVMAKKIFFTQAHNTGAMLTRKNIPSEKDPKRAVEMAANLLEQMGYGKIKLHQFDQSGRVILRSGNSFEGKYQMEKFGKNNRDEPVCDILRGMATGAASEIFQDNVQANETLCIGEGDEVCEVVLKKGGKKGDKWLNQ